MISRKAGAAAIAAASLLFFACATKPAPVQQEAAAAETQKVRKERVVTVRVPVLVKAASYYADGLADSYSVYSYDDSQTKLLEKKSFDAARPDPVERVVFQYDGAGLIAETAYDADGKIKIRHEYSLDAEGRVATDRVLDSKGLVQTVSVYVYDSDGNKLEWKVIDRDSVTKADTSYSYQNGRLVLIQMKNASGALSGSIQIEYDAQGRELKRSYLGADGSLQKYELNIYAADAAGRLEALETHYPSGSLSARTAYTYGPDGEMLTAVDSDSRAAVKGSWKYEYRIREDQKTEVYYE